jgi:hypothetical protein
MKPTIMGNCLQCESALILDSSNLDASIGEHSVFEPRWKMSSPCSGRCSVREAIWGRIRLLRRDNFAIVGTNEPFFDAAIRRLVEVAGEPS